MEIKKLITKIAKENFFKWEKSLHTKQPKVVAGFYSFDATFLPTVSPDFKKGRKGAKDYFKHFLEKNPSGKIVKQSMQILGPKVYLHSGMYDFSLQPGGRRKKIVHARFSFVWQKNKAGKWVIIHHHSSIKPK